MVASVFVSRMAANAYSFIIYGQTQSETQENWKLYEKLKKIWGKNYYFCMRLTFCFKYSRQVHGGGKVWLG